MDEEIGNSKSLIQCCLLSTKIDNFVVCLKYKSGRRIADLACQWITYELMY